MSKKAFFAKYYERIDIDTLKKECYNVIVECDKAAFYKWSYYYELYQRQFSSYQQNGGKAVF